MNKQRIAIIIIAALGAIATFMPWSTLPVLGSMHGTDTKLWWFSLFFFTVPIIFALIGDKKIELKKDSLYTITVFSILAVAACVFQIYIYKSLGSRAQGPLDAVFASNLSIGFGLYIAILSGIALPVFGFLMKDSNGNKEQTTYKPKRYSSDKIAEKYKTEIIKPLKNEEKIEEPKKEENKIDKEDHRRFMPKWKTAHNII